MNIFFGQIYIQPGIAFPFTHGFQVVLGKSVSELMKSSASFERKFGLDWSVMLRISAKSGLSDIEVKGPTVFRRSKDVEFTLFLPYDHIAAKQDWHVLALEYILSGACIAFDRLELCTDLLAKQKYKLVKAVFLNESMIKNRP